jgi:hypothetical protein
VKKALSTLQLSTLFSSQNSQLSKQDDPANRDRIHPGLAILQGIHRTGAEPHNSPGSASPAPPHPPDPGRLRPNPQLHHRGRLPGRAALVTGRYRRQVWKEYSLGWKANPLCWRRTETADTVSLPSVSRTTVEVEVLLNLVAELTRGAFRAGLQWSGWTARWSPPRGAVWELARKGQAEDHQIKFFNNFLINFY